MCLNKVTKREPHNRRIVNGFKVILYNPTRSVFAASNRKTHLEADVWMKAEKVEIETDSQLDKNGDPVIYTSGFHVWRSKKAAEAWLEDTWADDPYVIPVRGKGIRVIGTQDGHRVYVCDELHINSKDLPKSV